MTELQLLCKLRVDGTIDDEEFVRYAYFIGLFNKVPVKKTPAERSKRVTFQTLTPEQVSQIKKMCDEGFTHEAVAAAVGTTASSVGHINRNFERYRSLENP